MTVPSPARLAEQAMFDALDNIGAFDGSNDEPRDREYIRTCLAPLLAGLREATDALDKVRALADRWARDLSPHWRDAAARLRAVLPADHGQEEQR